MSPGIQALDCCRRCHQLCRLKLFCIATVWSGLTTIHKCTLCVALNRRGGYESDAALRVDQQSRIHKLVREKRIVVIGKDRLQLDGAGGRIDLIVKCKQSARGNFLLLSAVKRIDRQAGCRDAIAAGFAADSLRQH